MYKYDYFISYRRASGGALAARTVKSILRKYGKTAFLDVDDIKAGYEYEPQIYSAIENSKDFILILNEESWREKETIDIYYNEIIKITKQDGKIVPIEFAKDVLKSIPDGEGCVLYKQLNRNIKKFEKVSYSHDEHFLFEKLLCDKLSLPYSPDSQIENLPQFSMPFEIEEDDLIKRDEKVKTLSDEVISHRVFNLVGIGGSGKTTLTYLLTDKYKHFFSNIAYVVINGNIKEDFVAQINSTLNFDFAPNVSTDDKYKTIISFMDKYKTGNNLLILDVNETADKTAIEDYAKKLKNNNLPTNKIYPNGWNILILSRKKFGDFRNENISNDQDKAFLKELFLKKADKNEDDFDDYDGLFELIKYSPLLAEQLGIYFECQPIPSLEEIKGILYGDLRDEEIHGTNAHNRDREERTLICFLKNLIDYQEFTDDEKTVLRHFVLWKSEYISLNIISDLLKDTCHNLNKALGSLAKRSIFDYDQKGKTAYYKLHGLLADSLREQIDVTKQDYKTYFDNIERIEDYNFREFLSYADCIGNSLCEYEITTNVWLLNHTALKFYDTWKTDYAQTLYDKCIEISNQRLETEPENTYYLEDLSFTYYNLANLQAYRLNDYESAEKNCNNAIKIGERIIEISDTPKYLNSLATRYNNLAVLQADKLNDPESAETNFLEAIKILEKITESSDDPEYLYGLCRTYYNLANLQDDSLNDSKSAEIHYDKAIKIGKEIREVSDNPEYLNQLSGAYNNLADLQKDQKRYDSAIENCIKSTEIDAILKDTNLEYLVDWINSKDLLARLYIATDNPTEARAIVDEIKPEAEKLLEEFPDDGYLKEVYGWIKDTESKLNF
ncbi:MAG: toll/interleukin-1 receptor domain-containing protein [Bacteroidales bacterium]|nr:toll/interleukin-1 receptor domain-containing protein [Bacteroidales bacterium]